MEDKEKCIVLFWLINWHIYYDTVVPNSYEKKVHLIILSLLIH